MQTAFPTLPAAGRSATDLAAFQAERLASARERYASEPVQSMRWISDYQLEIQLPGSTVVLVYATDGLERWLSGLRAAGAFDEPADVEETPGSSVMARAA